MAAPIAVAPGGLGIRPHSRGGAEQGLQTIGQGQTAVHLLPEQLAAAAMDRKRAVMQITGLVAERIADAAPVLGFHGEADLSTQIRSGIGHACRWQQAPFSATRP